MAYDGQRLQRDLQYGLQREQLAIDVLTDLLQKDIYKADAKDDLQLATDLITEDGERIGVRCRDYRSYHRYTNEFTIRCSRPNGQITELQKIVNGCGDAMFYAFDHDGRFVEWRFINLHVFRKWYKEGMGTRKNNDGETGFLAFRYNEFPSHLLIDKQDLSLCESVSLLTNAHHTERQRLHSLLLTFRHDQELAKAI